MNFLYQVVIVGMEHIPLRTNHKGALDLLIAFSGDRRLTSQVVAARVMKQVSRGITYSNECMTLSKVKKKKAKNGTPKRLSASNKK